MAYLMCMDTPVYSTRAKQILAPHLMPCPDEFYIQWRDSRRFIRGVNRLPEEDEKHLGADSVTARRRLSLSDSYWIKYNKDPVRNFAEITPYTNDFFENGVCLSTKSAPSLTVGGSVNKNWRRLPDGTTALYKVMRSDWVHAEVAAVALAQKLKLPVNHITHLSDTELLVHNFTKQGTMLMHLQPWDLEVKTRAKVSTNFGYTFSEVDVVYKRLGISGDFHIVTILFDAVVGNYDRVRNLSNGGYIKSGIDGKNMHCPLYDFNLAHPNQKHMYIHIVRAQITEKHKALLRRWYPAVEAHGIPFWVENINDLLNA